ncbi:Spy/CpxP family protein refolding chaperone [candidate division WOR-3 bacterium]|nr:Spy/CpxP family protein refolding chaperone [candidate division WOR-3 bacterium]
MKFVTATLIALALISQSAFGGAFETLKQFGFENERRPERQEFREQENGPGFMGRIFEELEMSEDQVDRIKSLFEENRNKTRESREKMREIFDQIKETVQEDGSRNTVETLVGQVMDIERQIAFDRVDLYYSFRTELTDEQLEKLPEGFFARMLLPSPGNRDERNNQRPPRFQDR